MRLICILLKIAFLYSLLGANQATAEDICANGLKQMKNASDSAVYVKGDSKCVFNHGAQPVQELIQNLMKQCNGITTHCEVVYYHSRLEKASDRDVCNQTLDLDKTTFSGAGTSFAVDEGRLFVYARHLTVEKCRVAMGLPADPFEEYKSKTDLQVCMAALNLASGRFYPSDYFSVKLVINRKLSEAACLNEVTSELAKATDRSLCNSATQDLGKGPVWATAGEDQVWVSAAKLKDLQLSQCNYFIAQKSKLCTLAFLAHDTTNADALTELKYREIGREDCLAYVDPNDACRLALNAEKDGWSENVDETTLFAKEALDLKKRGLGDCRLSIGLPRQILLPKEVNAVQGQLKSWMDFTSDVHEDENAGNDYGKISELAKNCSDAIYKDSKQDFTTYCEKFMVSIQAVGQFKSYLSHIQEEKQKAESQQAELSRVKDDISKLLANIDEYAKKSGYASRSFDLISNAVSLKSLSEAAGVPEKAKLVGELQSVSDELLHDQGYSQYLADKEKEGDRLLAQESKKLSSAKDFMTDYVAHNLLSKQSGELLSAIKEVDGILASKDISQISFETRLMLKLFTTFNITGDYNAFVISKCGTNNAGGCSQPATNSNVDIDTQQKITTNTPPATTSADGRRIALVMGNSAYQNANKLPNPKNDAAAIAAKLKSLGFEVTEAEDLDKAGMDRTVRQFENSLAGSKVALLFYAGHGMQFEGHNYLIPIDAKLADATAISFETVSVDQILNTMTDPNRVSIAMLDSCRDNPLARSFSRKLSRSSAVGSGLAAAAIDGGGILIGFATAPDQTASDGDGDHSPFTKALLDNLDARGVEVGLMFKHVRQEVMSITQNSQQPWENSSIGEFYLNP